MQILALQKPKNQTPCPSSQSLTEKAVLHRRPAHTESKSCVFCFIPVLGYQEALLNLPQLLCLPLKGESSGLLLKVKGRGVRHGELTPLPISVTFGPYTLVQKTESGLRNGSGSRFSTLPEHIEWLTTIYTQFQGV